MIFLIITFRGVQNSVRRKNLQYPTHSPQIWHRILSMYEKQHIKKSEAWYVPKKNYHCLNIINNAKHCVLVSRQSHFIARVDVKIALVWQATQILVVKVHSM